MYTAAHFTSVSPRHEGGDALRNWMERLAERRPELLLHRLVLPGTHNSATETVEVAFDSELTNRVMPQFLKRIIAGWTINQTASLREQLDLGIRVFDVDVRKNEKRGGTYVVDHFFDCGSVEERFREIGEFLRETNEVVVVLLVARNNGVRREELREIVVRALGGTAELVGDAHDFRNLTLGEVCRGSEEQREQKQKEEGKGETSAADDASLDEKKERRRRPRLFLLWKHPVRHIWMGGGVNPSSLPNETNLTSQIPTNNNNTNRLETMMREAAPHRHHHHHDVKVERDPTELSHDSSVTALPTQGGCECATFLEGDDDDEENKKQRVVVARETTIYCDEQSILVCENWAHSASAAAVRLHAENFMRHRCVEKCPGVFQGIAYVATPDARSIIKSTLLHRRDANLVRLARKDVNPTFSSFLRENQLLVRSRVNYFGFDHPSAAMVEEVIRLNDDL